MLEIFFVNSTELKYVIKNRHYSIIYWFIHNGIPMFRVVGNTRYNTDWSVCYFPISMHRNSDPTCNQCRTTRCCAAHGKWCKQRIKHHRCGCFNRVDSEWHSHKCICHRCIEIMAQKDEQWALENNYNDLDYHIYSNL